MRHVLGPAAPDKEVKATVRRTCVNIAKGHYELFRLSRLSADEIRDLVEIEGLENVRGARVAGKGVIAISAHYGNVDVVVQAPLLHGIPMNGAVMHVQPERLFRYLLKVRQTHGLRLIPADGVLIGLVRALKRGEVVALPCDRVIADNTREIEFFGSPALLPDGPMRLALRTGAALVPAFATRLPGDTFKIQIEPPLELQRSADHEADIDAGMKQVARVMERHISRDPSQWLVAAPLWPPQSREPDQTT
jgi:KDO2-lipid IV(A) lauroyltransferase